MTPIVGPVSFNERRRRANWYLNELLQSDPPLSKWGQDFVSSAMQEPGILYLMAMFAESERQSVEDGKDSRLEMGTNRKFREDDL